MFGFRDATAPWHSLLNRPVLPFLPESQKISLFFIVHNFNLTNNKVQMVQLHQLLLKLSKMPSLSIDWYFWNCQKIHKILTMVQTNYILHSELIFVNCHFKINVTCSHSSKLKKSVLSTSILTTHNNSIEKEYDALWCKKTYILFYLMWQKPCR